MYNKCNIKHMTLHNAIPGSLSLSTANGNAIVGKRLTSIVYVMRRVFKFQCYPNFQTMYSPGTFTWELMSVFSIFRFAYNILYHTIYIFIIINYLLLCISF